MLAAACDSRTAKEKGKDYGDEKLGYAEGVADSLKEHGKSLGRKTGQGVGDLVRGVGSGVKDVAHPPVKVALEKECLAAGLKLERANEGKSHDGKTDVEVLITFTQPYHGTLELSAFDEKNERRGIGLVSDLEILKPRTQLLTFAFPESTRLSDIARFTLKHRSLAQVILGEGAEELTVNGVKREGSKVALYLMFPKKFKNALQLRLYDSEDKELGRSSAVKLKVDADSAQYVDFEFDVRTPIDEVEKYRLVTVSAKK